MDVLAHLVVNSPPEGSVLGRIVAEEHERSCFEILVAINHLIALARSMGEVRAELAAIRTKEGKPSPSLVSRNGVVYGTVDEVLCKANLEHGRAFLPFGGNDPYTEVSQIPQFQTAKRTTDKPWSGFSSCRECGKEFLNGDGEPKISGFAFCDETDSAQGDCKRAWLAKEVHKPLCERKIHHKSVDGVIAHSEGERQGKWTASFAHSRVSKAERARYEKKLFADVATYRAKDQSRREAVTALKKSADIYWKFCVNFEFPKVYDKKAMEEATEHLIESVPHDHLESLARRAAHRGLLEGSFLQEEQHESRPIETTRRTRSRHYVLGKRGHMSAEELSFVRQQDSNLVMEL